MRKFLLCERFVTLLPVRSDCTIKKDTHIFVSVCSDFNGDCLRAVPCLFLSVHAGDFQQRALAQIIEARNGTAHAHHRDQRAQPHAQQYIAEAEADDQ